MHKHIRSVIIKSKWRTSQIVNKGDDRVSKMKALALFGATALTLVGCGAGDTAETEDEVEEPGTEEVEEVEDEDLEDEDLDVEFEDESDENLEDEDLEDEDLDEEE